MKDQDENDELTFQLLGGQAKQLVENLSKRPEQTGDCPNAPTDEEKRVSDPEQRSPYVDWGLDKIRAFERRYSPEQRSRRKKSP